MAIKISILFSGIFFLAGLISGIWKYVCIKRSPDKSAPVYVSKTHTSCFMYSFAALLVGKLVESNQFSVNLNIFISSLLFLFFSLSIISYIVYGLNSEIKNQFSVPVTIGDRELPEFMRDLFMVSLILVEVIAFCILFFAFIYSNFI